MYLHPLEKEHRTRPAEYLKRSYIAPVPARKKQNVPSTSEIYWTLARMGMNVSWLRYQSGRILYINTNVYLTHPIRNNLFCAFYEAMFVHDDRMA